MKTVRLLVVGLLIYQNIDAQNFILEESSVSKKRNADLYMAAAKKCLMVLEKKESLAAQIQFSNSAILTSNSINDLSDRFMLLRPKSRPEYNNAPHLTRNFSNPDKQIKFNYAFLQPDKKSTRDFLQVIIFFDKMSESPKVQDIKFKTKTDNAEISLTEKEIMKVKGITPPEDKVTVAKKPASPKKKNSSSKKVTPVTKK